MTHRPRQLLHQLLRLCQVLWRGPPYQLLQLGALCRPVLFLQLFRGLEVLRQLYRCCTYFVWILQRQRPRRVKRLEPVTLVAQQPVHVADVHQVLLVL